jgi:hypothetical protein
MCPHRPSAQQNPAGAVDCCFESCWSIFVEEFKARLRFSEYFWPSTQYSTVLCTVRTELHAQAEGGADENS